MSIPVSGSEELYNRLRRVIDELVRVELGGGLEVSGLLYVILVKFVVDAKLLVLKKGFKPYEAILAVLEYYMEDGLEEILDIIEKIGEDLESGRLKL